MVKVKFKERNGKDLLYYLDFVETSLDRANEQALMNFCTIDDEEITIDQIAAMSDRAYLTLVNRVFAIDRSLAKFDDDKVIFTLPDLEIEIERKKINRNTITELQTSMKRNGSSSTKILIPFVTKMWDVTETFLLENNYQILIALIEDVNFFLSEIAKPKDEFDLDLTI